MKANSCSVTCGYGTREVFYGCNEREITRCYAGPCGEFELLRI